MCTYKPAFTISSLFNETADKCFISLINGNYQCDWRLKTILNKNYCKTVSFIF